MSQITLKITEKVSLFNHPLVLCIPQEDQVRRIRDNRNGEIFRELPWHQIRVGQICKIRCDEFLPADLVLLGSNDPQGNFYA
jgi:magnesium-transporting ATPase (P-type)